MSISFNVLIAQGSADVALEHFREELNVDFAQDGDVWAANLLGALSTIDDDHGLVDDDELKLSEYKCNVTFTSFSSSAVPPSLRESGLLTIARIFASTYQNATGDGCLLLQELQNEISVIDDAG